MALPQTAIEQLSHRPQATPGWFGRLLMFSATLFFIVLIVYIGLEFGFKAYVNRQVRALDTQIKNSALQIPINDQRNAIGFYSQLINIRFLLENHVTITPLFKWLEQNTIPSAYIDKLSVNTTNNQITFSAVARTMDDMTSQLQTFQNSPMVTKFTFSNIRFNTTKNTWEFDGILTFTSSFLRPNAQAPSMQQQ